MTTLGVNSSTQVGLTFSEVTGRVVNNIKTVVYMGKDILKICYNNLWRISLINDFDML